MRNIRYPHQTNTFVGGMNMDIDPSSIPQNQYQYAENVRVISNKDNTFGVLQGIDGFVQVNPTGSIGNGETILHTTVIRDYGIVFTRTTSGNICIYRFDFSGSKLEPTITRLINLEMNLSTPIDTVCRWEDENNIKVYFADGVNQLRVINIAPSRDGEKASLTADKLNIVPSSNLPQIKVVGFGSGSLTSGMIQYAYQLFNVRGSETAISVLSKQYHLSRNDGTGNTDTENVIGSVKGANSGKSLSLQVTLDNNIASNFDRARIYSIHYDSNNTLPEITILDEVAITGSTIRFTDTGSAALSEITVDEFNALTSYIFIPKVIETKNNILFAADTTEDTFNVDYDARAYRTNSSGNILLLANDTSQNLSFSRSNLDFQNVPVDHDCICPYNVGDDSYFYGYDNGALTIGGIGKNVSFQLLTTDLIVGGQATTSSTTNLSGAHWILNASAFNANMSLNRYNPATNQKVFYMNVPDYIQNTDIKNFSNSQATALLRGYMRDEIYRFGVVFYNHNNVPSTVKWIADIKMRKATDAGAETFTANFTLANNGNGQGNDLVCHSMGISFKFNNIPDGVNRLEIVRCERTLSDRTILSQGVISDVIDYSSSSNLLFAYPFIAYSGSAKYRSTGTGNNNYDITVDLAASASQEYFSFISPELCINRENAQDLLDQANSMDAVYYLTSRVVNTTDDANYATFVSAQRKKDIFGDGTIKTYSSSYTRNTGGIYTNGMYVYLGATLPYDACLGKYYWRQNVTGTADILDIRMAHQIDPTNQSIGVTATEADVDWITNGVPTLIGTKSYYNWVWDTDSSGISDDNNNIRRSGPHGICAIFRSSNMTNRIPRIYASTTDPYNITGTYLVNLKQSVIPYGGNSYSARQNSTYITTGTVADLTSTSVECITFGGDTYVSVLDYAVMCLEYDREDPHEDDRNRHLQYTGAYIPVETTINLDLRSDDVQISKTYDGAGYANHLVQHDPIQIGNAYSQSVALYAYNDAYSAQPTARVYSDSGLYSIDNLHTDYRIYASEQKTNNEVTDSWTKFKVANYIDVDSQYGPINKLLTFNNVLYFFQENAFGTAAVNERSLIQDGNPGALTLGTGDVLSRFDYFTVTNGLKEGHLRAVTTSDGVLYWYDEKRAEICGFDGNINAVSKLKGVQSYLNEATNFNNDPRLIYDKKYNDMLSTIDNNKTLSFNEQLGVFVSFLTYYPDWHFEFTDGIYSFNGLTLYKHNAGDDRNLYNNTSKVSHIQFVVNQDYPVTKAFMNVKYPAEFTTGTNFQDIYFRTKRQESFKVGEFVTSMGIDYREDDYSFTVPHSSRELNVAEELVNKSFRDRMKGKYMICYYSYDCNDGKTFQVPFINTYYNHSFL